MRTVKEDKVIPMFIVDILTTSVTEEYIATTSLAIVNNELQRMRIEATVAKF
jgi:hypothetical protein